LAIRTCGGRLFKREREKEVSSGNASSGGALTDFVEADIECIRVRNELRA